VVFDKTGTLTEGKPRVQEVIAIRDDNDDNSSSIDDRSDISRNRERMLQIVMKKRDDYGGVEKEDDVEGFVLRIAAIAEQSSNHPLSRAIIEVGRLITITTIFLVHPVYNYFKYVCFYLSMRLFIH